MRSVIISSEIEGVPSRLPRSPMNPPPTSASLSTPKGAQRAAAAAADPNDIHIGDWVDRWLPPWAEPYARLARWDRPIGTWLLLFPGWWGIALAGPRWPDPLLLLLFAIGAVAMRGAGCTLNDIADRPGYGAAGDPVHARPARGRGRGTAQPEPHLLDLGPRRVGADRHLSIYEADHVLAAALSRAEFQLGSTAGLGGGDRRPLLAAASALCRRYFLDDRLRHDLCASGQGGRRAHRYQILGPGARRADPAVAVRLLCRSGPAMGRRGQRGGARRSVLDRARRRCGTAFLAGGAGRHRKRR